MHSFFDECGSAELILLQRDMDKDQRQHLENVVGFYPSMWRAEVPFIDCSMPFYVLTSCYK